MNANLNDLIKNNMNAKSSDELKWILSSKEKQSDEVIKAIKEILEERENPYNSEKIKDAAKNDINELLAQEISLLPEGNIFNLVWGVAIFYIGYILSSSQYLSNAFMMFGALMATVGLLSFLWKAAILYLFEAVIFGVISITFLSNVKLPINYGRAALGGAFIIYAIFIIFSNISRYFDLVSVRKEIKLIRRSK